MFDSGDLYLVWYYCELGVGCFEVFVGDKGEVDLGLDWVIW